MASVEEDVMVMIPNVSIIVPIYNAEKYLNRCVESLLSQTLRNIEIILVDDGSTDNSGKIANEYFNSDNRIKFIHKKNGGLSSARNAGLNIAVGEYIGFVDSDDWVKKDMYERLYNIASKRSFDIVMSEFYRVTNDGSISEIHLLLKEEQYEGEKIIDEILLPMIGAKNYEKNDVSVDMCVTKNLYRRDIIEKSNIRFVSEREYISEDILFNIEAFRNSTCVGTVKIPLYYYSINVLSLTQTYKKGRYIKECALFEYLKDRLKQIGLFDKGIERLQRTFIGRARVAIIQEARDNQQETVTKRIKNIKEITISETLVNCLKNYPIHHLPLKLCIVTYCMKFQLALLLFLITVNHKRK